MVQYLCKVRDWVSRNVAKTVISASVLFLSVQSFNAQTMYGLSGTDLVTFDASTPGAVNTVAMIAGVDPTQTLVGLDFRPATGQLFGLGYESTSGNARLYTIDLATANATPVGMADFVVGAGETSFGFDFNPTVDRIRLVTGSGLNFRLNPNTGGVVANDGAINIAVGDINNGNTAVISGSGYTNNFIGSTATTLYNVDFSLNALFTQIPPNAGTLNTVGDLSAVGYMAAGSDQTSFDILFDSNTKTNIAYLSTTTLNGNEFFTVDLTNGATTSLGVFGQAISDFTAQVTVDNASALVGYLAYALTSTNQLITFDTGNPMNIRNQYSLSGVTAGQTLVGLDFRPATGQLYGLGYNATTGEAQLYTINKSNGVATTIGALSTLATGMTGITVDFNPTVDRIRVTSRQNNNYRLHPVTGALLVTDGNLAYAGTDANSAAVAEVAAGAYTNSYIGATGTALYNYDVNLNIITLQNPPNNGVLNTIGSTGITVNLTGGLDLDFYFDPATKMNNNFLVANVDANLNDDLYTIDLTTGAATLVGSIGNGIQVTTMAIETTPNIPAAVAGEIIYGVTSNQYLVKFDSQDPSIVRTHLAITGVTAGQTIQGIDVRPATGELYALGYDNTTGDVQFYTVDTTTAVATAVAAAVNVAPSLNRLGFDFNPTVDRIRVVSTTGMNYRFHPTTGALAATDGNLAYATGDVNEGQTPNVATVAYTNSYGGSKVTTLYDFDDALNTIAKQTPPNNGTLVTIGSTGLTQSATDVTSDMDVLFDHTTKTNTAYLVSNMTANDELYTLDLATGNATSVGAIGNGIAVRDIAVRITNVTSVTSTTSTIDSVVCNTYTAPDNKVYTASGTYTAVIPNAAGYDSLITINLVVNSSSMNSITEIACDTYTSNSGMVYTSTGIYTETLTNAAGCDSVLTIDLTINNSTTNTITATSCESYTSASGMVYTTTGIYTETFTNAVGCDSVLTLDLTINMPTSSTITETACGSYTSPSGKVFTMSGMYMDTIPNLSMCDSVITIDLTINPISTSTIDTVQCGGSYTAPDNQVYTSSGTYTATFTAANGCDSIVTINLTINQPSTSTLTVATCGSYTAADGQVLTTSGMYNIVVPNSVGCDSTIALDLTINPGANTTATVDTVQCGGSYTAADGMVYTTSGTYTATIPSAAGCDSIITINLTINQATTSTLTVVTCGSYMAADGQELTASGMYNIVIPNAVGCDSTIALDLTINPGANSTATVDTVQCGGSYTAADGMVYTTSGTYTATIPSASGCDSIITINLTINQATSSNLTVTACESYTAADGQVLTTSGMYSIVIPNAAGCDSTIALDLTINNATTSTITETACVTYTAPSGAVYTTSGMYMDTILNALGCDSIITIDLTITPLTVPTFTAVGPFCSGDAIPALPTTSNENITGTWSPVINNTATTTYTFTPDANQCADVTTLTITINPAGTPTFNPIPAFCSGSTAPALPTASIEGITGTWNPATINNTTTGTYTFTPDGSGCATSTTLTVTVNARVTPTFAPITPFCSGATAPTLQGNSLNGVSGTWAPATVNNQTTGTYTFTPAANACATTTSLTVTVRPTPTVTVSSNSKQTSPICVGSKLILTATTAVTGASFSWNGPAFTSTLQNPEIINATEANAGLYSVTATLQGCTSSGSTTVAIDKCTSIEDNAAALFSVYPNPTSGLISIEFNQVVNETISVYDNVGRLVQTVEVNGLKSNIDLTNVSNGTYIVKIGTQTKQVVKQ